LDIDIRDWFWNLKSIRIRALTMSIPFRGHQRETAEKGSRLLDLTAAESGAHEASFLFEK
jgi:hypothetical protein